MNRSTASTVHDEVATGTMELADVLQLSAENRPELVRAAREYRFEQAEAVIYKGQEVSGAYVVLEGQLRVYTYSPKGAEVTLYLLRPGETCVLALNCLFNELRYPAWVTAEPGSRVAMIPGDLYRRLFSTEAHVQDMTVTALSTLVFRLMDQLEEVQTCNLDQRLARFLLNHASSDGTVKMTQQVIAGHLGTTREVVARLMQGLVSGNMVSTHRGRVQIDDAARLAQTLVPQDAG